MYVITLFLSYATDFMLLVSVDWNVRLSNLMARRRGCDPYHIPRIPPNVTLVVIGETAALPSVQFREAKCSNCCSCHNLVASKNVLDGRSSS
jgi:hypothetical protein